MKLTPDEIHTLCLARSLIRDMANGWPVGELGAPPEEVCAALSVIIGDKYDFETSNVDEGDE